MGERRTVVWVLLVTLALGLVAGALIERATPALGSFLNENSAVIFGIGIIFLEGPSLVLSIVLPRRITRIWVRNALEAGGPFMAFAGYVLAYGLLLNPPFRFGPWLPHP